MAGASGSAFLTIEDMVSGTRTRAIASKNFHAASRPSQTATVVCTEGGPHEHAAAHHERHHERVAATLVSLGDDRPHQADVDLRFLAGLAVDDEHRGALLAPPERLHREAAERVVADLEPVVALEQRVDLPQAQGATLREPRDDPLPV